MKDYQEFSKKDPTIKEFQDDFEQLRGDISIDGETLDSHDTIPCSVQVNCINSDKMFSIVGLNISQLPGCGCWSAIVIEIEEDK